MKKIPSVFQRNYDGDRLIRDEVVSGCEWVLAGEGQATIKWDGTACLVKGGLLFKRYDAKRGKTPPEGFIPAQEPDSATGHWPGWLLVGEGSEDRWHREGFESFPFLGDGTYELVGPKVQGNPHRFSGHLLAPHREPATLEEAVPRDFQGLKRFLAAFQYEGIVFHHPDGRMAKVKRRDFGLPWPV